jgi:hypothetical protein
VDAQPLSELELARLKARTGLQRVAADWRRPSDSWQQTLRWIRHHAVSELGYWQAALPTVVRSDFIFTLVLWVAVFSVAAAVVALPNIPLTVRYSAGLVAVAYLYLYAELARSRRPVPGRRFLLGAADIGVVAALGAMSVPYVGYANVLLFFGAARVAARFQDPRVLIAGGVMLVPFELAGHAAPLSMLIDAFAVLTTMLLVIHLTTTLEGAQQAAQRHNALTLLTSSLARVRDEDALFAQLATQAPLLAPDCAWAFWIKDPGSDDFRAVRWFGLREGELPGFTFTPTLGADRTQPVLINGPLPGTSVGECTLLYPTSADGELNGLITIAGRRGGLSAGSRSLIQGVAEEMGATLQRLQALDDERLRTEAMEHANRLAGLAARHASDQAAALEAIRPAVADMLRSESLHLEWVHGDRLALVVSDHDPLQGHAPGWLSLAGTRSADALLQKHAVREPMTGRRPEDLFFVPAGLRHVAVAPFRCGELEGTLQLSRRLPRPYAAGEVLLLQLLADRLGLLFAAGLMPTDAKSATVGVGR